MHITRIILKDGQILTGNIEKFKPEDNYIKLFNTDNILLNDIESAVTEGERLGHGIIGNQDELLRAKQYMQDARKYNWHKKELPLQDWEN